MFGDCGYVSSHIRGFSKTLTFPPLLGVIASLAFPFYPLRGMHPRETQLTRFQCQHNVSCCKKHRLVIAAELQGRRGREAEVQLCLELALLCCWPRRLTASVSSDLSVAKDQNAQTSERTGGCAQHVTVLNENFSPSQKPQGCRGCTSSAAYPTAALAQAARGISALRQISTWQVQLETVWSGVSHWTDWALQYC